MKRKGTISIRINEQKRTYDETQENTTSEVKLEDYKTSRGLYSIPLNIWFNLSDDDQSKIKLINSKIRKQGNNNQDRTIITPRRSSQPNGDLRSEIDGTSRHKRQKTVQFLDDNDIKMTKKEGQQTVPNREIQQRRGSLTFKLKNE